MKTNRVVISVLMIMLISGCGTFKTATVYVAEDQFMKKYELIRKVVQEEAVNNGWNQLNEQNSEVKPSPYNNWEGEILYRLKTVHGIDTLRVQFQKRGKEIRVYMLGTGMQANGESAVKAIVSKLQQLFKNSIRIESKFRENTLYVTIATSSGVSVAEVFL